MSTTPLGLEDDTNLALTKPHFGILKCNVDCATFAAEGKIVFGVCFREPQLF